MVMAVVARRGKVVHGHAVGVHRPIHVLLKKEKKEKKVRRRSEKGNVRMCDKK